ncbi:alpha/beta fold hydrolase [Aeromicrobium sp. CTD01-1L150]|uniref:alpha/beta fold hydrolase n=1 Tax=Aeromicrobium sp. CTD01-1L150 TaxID=3341830 RepID=UPI0035BEF31E
MCPAHRPGERLPGVPAPSVRIRSHDGVVLGADAWGPEDGPPLVLLHGGGQTRHAWKSAGHTLGVHGFRALAYDARGHGDSSWSQDGDYSEAALVADLRAVVASFAGVRPCILVGASMGGLTSLAAIGRGEVLASALVLVDVVPRVDGAGVQRIADFMDAGRDGFDSLDQMVDAIAVFQPHRRRPGSISGVAKNARLDADGRYRWHWDPAVTPESDLEQMAARHERYAQAVDVPTLMVRGELSEVVREDGTQDFLRLMPHAQVDEVAGASHMVAGDDNDAFVERIVAFLRGHRTSSPPD